MTPSRGTAITTIATAVAANDHDDGSDSAQSTYIPILCHLDMRTDAIELL